MEEIEIRGHTFWKGSERVSNDSSIVLGASYDEHSKSLRSNVYTDHILVVLHQRHRLPASVSTTKTERSSR